MINRFSSGGLGATTGGIPFGVPPISGTQHVHRREGLQRGRPRSRQPGHQDLRLRWYLSSSSLSLLFFLFRFIFPVCSVLSFLCFVRFGLVDYPFLGIFPHKSMRFTRFAQ